MKIYALSIGLDSSGAPHVAWHWPWSLTWSWGLWFRRGASGRLGFYSLPTCGGQSRHCGLNTPLFSVSYQSQPTMRKQTEEQIQEQRIGSALARYERLRSCTTRWHELSVSMGYDGTEDALRSLQAMKRGPRPIPTEGKGVGNV